MKSNSYLLRLLFLIVTYFNYLDKTIKVLNDNFQRPNCLRLRVYNHAQDAQFENKRLSNCSMYF